MSSPYINPLDLKYILINTFAGNFEIFTGLLFLGLCILASLFRMPDRIFLLIIALASIILYNWINQGIYFLVLIIGGIATFWAISRVVKN